MCVYVLIKIVKIYQRATIPVGFVQSSGRNFVLKWEFSKNGKKKLVRLMSVHLLITVTESDSSGNIVQTCFKEI